ncbi:hypothetical protein HK104_001588 [Borealophlyctis nickersoniae]|nr:hypothetical protein HK104_001588 [Borealophlyctis nickersoniae]
MSDFGDFSTTPPSGLPMDDASDPTADFLAREQAILGADAALFGADGSVNVAAINAAGPGPVIGGFEADAFGEPAAFPPVASFGTPLSAAPSIPFENTGASSAGSFSSALPGIPAVPEPEPEPEVIKQWRETFQSTISSRDAASKTKHEATLKSAKEALERFYAEYNDKKEKAIKKNKDVEKSLVAARDDTTSGTVWERVVKQIETTTPLSTSSGSSSSSGKGVVNLNPNKKPDDKSKDAAAKTGAKPGGKTRDTARMKQVLMSLRRDPKAPGVEASA